MIGKTPHRIGADPNSTTRNRRKLGVESVKVEDEHGKKTVWAWKLPLMLVGLDDLPNATVGVAD